MRDDVSPQLELASVAPDDLRSLTRKIRKRDPARVRAVAGSISELGFCAPVLIAENNLVLDGEIRVKAAKLLGLTALP